MRLSQCMRARFICKDSHIEPYGAIHCSAYPHKARLAVCPARSSWFTSNGGKARSGCWPSTRRLRDTLFSTQFSSAFSSNSGLPVLQKQVDQIKVPRNAGVHQQVPSFNHLCRSQASRRNGEKISVVSQPNSGRAAVCGGLDIVRCGCVMRTLLRVAATFGMLVRDTFHYDHELHLPNQTV